jgi:hypothetical protein
MFPNAVICRPHHPLREKSRRMEEQPTRRMTPWQVSRSLDVMRLSDQAWSRRGPRRRESAATKRHHSGRLFNCPAGRGGTAPAGPPAWRRTPFQGNAYGRICDPAALPGTGGAGRVDHRIIRWPIAWPVGSAARGRPVNSVGFATGPPDASRRVNGAVADHGCERVRCLLRSSVSPSMVDDQSVRAEGET